MDYRLCENKFGYFKIQVWEPPYKIFGIFPAKGEWVDLHRSKRHYVSDYEIFVTKAKAEKKIEKLIERDMLHNNEWHCPEEEL